MSELNELLKSLGACGEAAYADAVRQAKLKEYADLIRKKLAIPTPPVSGEQEQVCSQIEGRK